MPATADPELGVHKKDDDLFVKGGKKRTSSIGWKSAPRVAPRKTFKRLGLLVLIAAAAYLFIHNIPTDVGPRRTGRPNYPIAKAPSEAAPKPQAPSAIDTVDEDESEAGPPDRDYDGPVRFMELAETLHAISGTHGSSTLNKNVLFAASSLRSAGSLLPLACKMGRELRAYVHFALLSRNDIKIEELRAVNGIGKSCEIIFHDARAEFPSISSDERFAKSVERALYHINNYMHPQAIIVDSSEAEEPLLLKSLQKQAKKMEIGQAIVELPGRAVDRLSWMSKLDAQSLSHWNRFSVDILVHAHAGASGSLIRLLKSLRAADYTASAVPHLTIELPEEIDPPTAQFLQTFHWPPRRASNPAIANQLTLRHRITRRGDTEEESSVRFLEGFWPLNTGLSHVLVLSPQVELSPNYFHYLKLALLEYRYSGPAIYQAWDKRVFSLSLDLPSKILDGRAPFVPPTGQVGRPDGPELGAASSSHTTSFLWQAPNSNAALFLGERWAELHGFVSQLLEAQHGFQSTPALLAEKSVSKDYPSWLEHALRLCRARGYMTVYPGADLAASLATTHGELYQKPEEYENDKSRTKHGDEDEVILRHGTLLDGLPNGEGLPRFNEMTLLSWDDNRISLEDLNEESIKYAAGFRRTVGGCRTGQAAEPDPSAKDLYCMGDDGV
ncbi:hypothetical protein INS49_000700 [Diaporthe citri]|uniref:uncharacterized protein n=1 Tax=Diaporthe citri TaxID=83186 RepID=UPI001C80DEEB|nr:uncharacterized protein INS49_000700 [Diaporthe citri]KAG6366523.1 hypothetical protein INS49_000700 [Diaporthe citri]